MRAGKPFYVAAGFRRPHTPYIAPEKYYSLYQPQALEPRWGPPGHAAKLPKLALSYNLPKGERFPRENPGEVMQAYYAAISFMDAQVGVLLEAMDRLQLWDNTVVVFHGDHGYHLGEHEGLWHKLNLFEETTRVPLIIGAPGRKPAVATGLVELVDLYPTLAELAGLKAPADLEGTSFVRLLDQPSQTWKKAVFTVISRDGVSFQPSKGYDPSYIGRTVFDGRWRYTEWPDGGKELYDHKGDVYEYVNLAAEPKFSTQMAAMKQLLADGWKAARPSSDQMTLQR